jgi:hypothetical protein
MLREHVTKQVSRSESFCMASLSRSNGPGPDFGEVASDRAQSMITAIVQGIHLQSNHDESFKAIDGARKCPSKHVCRVCE